MYQSANRLESYSAKRDAVKAGPGWRSIPREFIADELAAGTLVEMRQQAYPHTDRLVGIDRLWSKRAPSGKAQRGLRERLLQHTILTATPPVSL